MSEVQRQKMKRLLKENDSLVKMQGKKMRKGKIPRVRNRGVRRRQSIPERRIEDNERRSLEIRG